MSRLTEIGFESDDEVLSQPRAGECADDVGVDRSLGAVMREIGQTLAGWLFFVIAVQLLLYGARLL